MLLIENYILYVQMCNQILMPNIIDIIFSYTDIIKLSISKFENYNISEIFSNNNINRFYKYIKINAGNCSVNIMLLLQNPSLDESKNKLSKIIKILLSYNPNINSIAIINSSPYIINKFTKENIHKFLSMKQENLEFINKILNKMNYDELFIGVGQHALNCGLKEFNTIYKSILNIIKELDLSQIKLKYFGCLVYNNTIPMYPISPKYINKINIQDLPLEILTNY